MYTITMITFMIFFLNSKHIYICKHIRRTSRFMSDFMCSLNLSPVVWLLRKKIRPKLIIGI